MTAAFVFAALLQVSPPAPRPSVPDPGVIAADQLVTPAGVQTVFAGRVAAVHFGSTANEVWVAVPGRIHRIDWWANRVLADASFDGTRGMHGLAVDPLARRVLVSSSGRLPASVEEARERGQPAVPGRPGGERDPGGVRR